MSIRSYTVYFGPLVTSKVQLKRRLPYGNPACTNRMSRLMEAFEGINDKRLIIAPGISLRAAGRASSFKKHIERLQHCIVYTLRQCPVKFIGQLLSPIYAAVSVAGFAKRRNISTFVQYCYFPDAVFTAIICKFLLGSKIVLDLEDICVPHISDWKAGSETKPFLQLWGWVLMRISIWVADLVIMPSKKFGRFIPAHKQLVVSGCQNVVGTLDVKDTESPLQLLFCGGITIENGACLLLEALQSLDDKPRPFVVHICGMCDLEWFKRGVAKLKYIDVRMHGYLNNEDFAYLYSVIDACLALQNPSGRQGLYKTPSKGYEALCSGKALIVSDIGDFADIPSSVCYHVRPYTPDALSGIMAGLTYKNVLDSRRRALQYARDNFDSRLVGKRISARLKDIRR